MDGFDILAVFSAVSAAREMALREGTPVLIESMAYRVGHHSTSDDSSRYRAKDEIEAWRCELAYYQNRVMIDLSNYEICNALF